MQLEGKVAVVTGASRGVGRATALELGRGGCAVAVNYSRSQAEAEAVVSEIESGGGRAVSIQADVAGDASCREMIEKAVSAFGGLDILVNNAGTTSFIHHNDLDAVSDDVWDRIMQVNVKGPFQCVRAAREHLEVGNGGVVINVTSTAGVAAKGSCIPYCCSKAALINMTISLARTLGPKIRVNAVAPGAIKGSWLKGGLGDNYDAALAANEELAVLDKVSRPEDVSAAILSLITGSDLVTGQNVICDGGVLIGPKM
jgi:3-oxoacyl-[acyl-carrier protein] reductase